MDIEVCAEGGYNVGWTNAGEWMEYTVNVVTSGMYKIDARVASGVNSSKKLHIELDGVNVSNTITVPYSGGWQSWTTVSVSTPVLATGVKVMRIVMETDGFNINKVVFTQLAAPVITSQPTVIAISDVAFLYAISASNLPTSYGATGLPAGLSIDTITGIISGIAAIGTYNVQLIAKNSLGIGTKALTITINPPVPVLSAASIIERKKDSLFTYAIIATNQPVHYAAAGLPVGLSVNETTGVITGVPTVAGTYTVTLSASNVSGTGTTQLVLAISEITGVPIDFVLMPNPVNPSTNGFLKASVSGWQGFADIEIVNVNGVLMQKGRVEIQNGIMLLDVYHLPAGAYVLRLKNGNTKLAKKFLVQYNK
ncbi:MAG: carbohydrate-binding protein [Sphingobacteriales bacterium]|nr:carbohydrate-binding protein [Sphingobacteriales bacterium]